MNINRKRKNLSNDLEDTIRRENLIINNANEYIELKNIAVSQNPGMPPQLEFRAHINLHTPEIVVSNNLFDDVVDVIYNSYYRDVAIDQLIVLYDGDVSSMIIISKLLIKTEATKIYLYTYHFHNNIRYSIKTELFEYLSLENSKVKEVKLHYQDFNHFRDNNQTILNINFLANSTQIESLELCHENIGVNKDVYHSQWHDHSKLVTNIFEMMANSITKIKNLSTLKLHDIRIDENNMDFLKSIALSCQNFKKISFINCEIVDSEAFNDCHLFLSFKNLESFNIISCTFGNVHYLMGGIIGDLSSLKNLKKIKITDSITTRNDLMTRNEIKPFSSSYLAQLSINDVNINHVLFLALRSKLNLYLLTNVSNINISGNKLSCSFDFYSLNVLICLSNKLQKINISNCGLVQDDIKDLSYSLQKSQSLKMINITSNMIENNELVKKLFANSDKPISLNRLILTHDNVIYKVIHRNHLHYICRESYIPGFVMVIAILKRLNFKLPPPIRFMIFQLLLDTSHAK